MKEKIQIFISKNGVWLGFFLLVAALTILTNGSFLQPRNLTNLLRQTSINGILASGMTLIILLGGIDLSIGSLVALTGILVGLSQVNWGWGATFAGSFGSIFLSMGAGLLIGCINGGLVALLGIAPFVITLGMMVIARGLALIFSNGSSISPMGESLAPLADAYVPILGSAIILFGIMALFLFQNRRSLSQAIFPLILFGALTFSFLSYKGLPVLVIFLLVVTSIVSFLLNRTSFGRSVYAIGSSERAAFWAGVPVKKVIWIVYSIMGLLAGLAGVLLTVRLNGADPNAGQLFELDAIAAVVIGGTSLKGGVGTVMGSFVGALIIASLNNGMDLLGVPSFYQMVFKGLIIVVAVALDRKQRQEV